MQNRSIKLSDVPGEVALRAGTRPSRATVYNWVKRGWLCVGPFKPFWTTSDDLDACLAEHRRAQP